MRGGLQRRMTERDEDEAARRRSVFPGGDTGPSEMTWRVAEFPTGAMTCGLNNPNARELKSRGPGNRGEQPCTKSGE